MKRYLIAVSFFFSFLLFSAGYGAVSRVDVGIKALRDGFYDVAIEEFRMSLKERKDPSVEFLLGLAYLKKGENGKSYRIFSKLMDSGCRIEGLTKYWSLSALGFSLDLVSQGKEGEASTILERILKVGGDGPTVQKARYILGGIYYRERRYRDVIEVLSPLYNSLDPYGMFILSESYFGVGNSAKSVDILKDMLKKGLKEGRNEVLSLVVERGGCSDSFDLVDVPGCLSYKPFFLRVLYCAIDSGNDGLIDKLNRFSMEKGLFRCETAYAVTSYMFSSGRFDDVLKESSLLSGCRLSGDRAVRIKFMKAFSMYKKGDMEGAYRLIFPIYVKLTGDMKSTASLMLYAYFKGKDDPSALAYLKDYLSSTHSCTFLKDGLAFFHGRGKYRAVVELYRGYSRMCNLDDKTLYLVGDSYLELGDGAGLKVLSGVKDPKLKDLVELKKVLFFCRRGPSPECLGAARLALGRVKDPSVKKKIKAILSLR